MEVRSVVDFGWHRDLRMVREVRTYDYASGNDVTTVQYHFYQVYTNQGQIQEAPKGNNIDLMV
jgi:hypothetical protein